LPALLARVLNLDFPSRVNISSRINIEDHPKNSLCHPFAAK
jgi:hypothetical protein